MLIFALKYLDVCRHPSVSGACPLKSWDVSLNSCVYVVPCLRMSKDTSLDTWCTTHQVLEYILRYMQWPSQRGCYWCSSTPFAHRKLAKFKLSCIDVP